MIEIIVPFGRAAEWWHDNKGQKGVMLSHDVIKWFQSNPSRYRREFILGVNKSQWAVRFQIEKPDVALLFKLTFGGA